MKRFIVGATVLLAACGPGMQGGGARVVSPLALEPPSTYSLIGYRQDLSLTGEQIDALDSIAVAVKRRNDPLVDSLRAIANTQSGRARGVIMLDETTRPLLEQVRENNLEAVREVQEVLDEDQQREVCRLLDRSRSGRAAARRGARAEQQREPPPMRGAAADVQLVMPMRTWPWCEPEAPAPGL